MAAHVVVSAEQVTEKRPAFTAYEVLCSCGARYNLNRWHLKFGGPGDVGGGLLVSDNPDHRWMLLVVALFAWGDTTAVERVRVFQEAGLSYECAETYVESQSPRRHAPPE